MAEETDLNRGIEFARDLKEIRKTNGISIDDIHEESKIPVGLIESFEENGLFDHTMFNRVYLRSFVRTYAEVIGISHERALTSLEAALDGTYQRELAVEYLGLEPPRESADEADDAIIPEPEPGPAEEQMPSPPERPAKPTPTAVEAEDEALDEEPAFLAEEEMVAASEPSPAADHRWASQSPPPSTAPRPRQPERSRTPWIVGGVVALLLVAAVWGAVQLGGGADPATDRTAAAAPDTTTQAADEVQPEQPSGPVTLGDSMRVTIASRDSQLVQDIKITVDNDLRRPYWLEAGESRTFLPQNRIVVEQELDVINLLVEGRPYPTDRVDPQGRIVITRDTALQFLQNAP